MSNRIALLLALFISLLPGVRADDLENILNRDRIAVQKLQNDADAAISKARSAEGSDPAQAVSILQNALNQVRGANFLDEQQRTALTRRIDVQLQQANQAARTRQQSIDQPIRQVTSRTNTSAPAHTAADIAKSFIDEGKAKIAVNDRIRRDTGVRTADLISPSQDLGLIGGDGVMEFPRNWVERSKTRAQFGGQIITPKESAVIKALDMTMSVDFNRATFREALGYLMDKSDQPIILDEASRKDAMVEYDDPVNFQAKKVTLRTALKKVLGDHGLTYVVKEGVIQVVTPERARTLMTVRTYPIYDLLVPDPVFGFNLPPQVELFRAQQMIDTLQHATDPGAWDINGGPGSITYNLATHSLVVRASAEVHFKSIGSGAP